MFRYSVILWLWAIPSYAQCNISVEGTARATQRMDIPSIETVRGLSTHDPAYIRAYTRSDTAMVIQVENTIYRALRIAEQRGCSVQFLDIQIEEIEKKNYYRPRVIRHSAVINGHLFIMSQSNGLQTTPYKWKYRYRVIVTQSSVPTPDTNRLVNGYLKK